MSDATSFNKTNVDNFFANLKTVFQRHQFGPEAIYNIDETGLPAVLRTQRERVIASKGSKQVGKATSTERDSLFTVYCGVNFKPYLLHDAPTGSDGSTCQITWTYSWN